MNNNNSKIIANNSDNISSENISSNNGDLKNYHKNIDSVDTPKNKNINNLNVESSHNDIVINSSNIKYNADENRYDITVNFTISGD
jgi:hypothetical protein